ncbi:MAG: hypothetical protein SOV77_04440, partial [Lachnospiraceae bacterium]|nr:hypothetical protein [Lachnospiraceae bacterium]
SQAIESVTEKRVAIPCENLASSQILTRNCNSSLCYGFLAKDIGYRPAYPTPLRRTHPITN